MTRDKGVPRPRSAASVDDSRDLRAAIREALAARTDDDARLRQTVFSYVSAERDAGVSPGIVLHRLTGLVQQSRGEATPEELELLRRVSLWCVEAYFGRMVLPEGLADVGSAARD